MYAPSKLEVGCSYFITTGDIKTILADWYRCLHGTKFESRTQMVVTECELLHFEDYIFAPQSCKCYGNLASKVERITNMDFWKRWSIEG